MGVGIGGPGFNGLGDEFFWTDLMSEFLNRFIWFTNSYYIMTYVLGTLIKGFKFNAHLITGKPFMQNMTREFFYKNTINNYRRLYNKTNIQNFKSQD